MSKVMTIAGMHRSGTSLTAMWLERCGLDLGSNLMKGQFDNPRGYFEDLYILKLHENDLQSKGLRTHGLNLINHNSFEFDQKTIQEAKSFIEKRGSSKDWGWKEPRSTLYLGDWKKLIPELKVLAVVRPFNEVVDSLVRRTKYSFINSKKYTPLVRFSYLAIFPFYLQLEKQRYLDAWIKYNQAILTFQQTYPDDIIIIELRKLIKFDNKVLGLINNKFSLNLMKKSITQFFDKSLLKESSNVVSLPANFVKEARVLQEHLFNISDI